MDDWFIYVFESPDDSYVAIAHDKDEAWSALESHLTEDGYGGVVDDLMCDYSLVARSKLTWDASGPAVILRYDH